MKNVMKSLAFPLMACGLFLASSVAKAQDIVSIYSDQANTTYFATGTDIDIKIRLWGDFRTRSVGGTTALYPQLRLIVNGDIAWAELFTLNRYLYAGGIYKTEAVFRYKVRPGDMAQPMKIFGNAGSSLPGDAYQFYPNGWEIYNYTTTSNAVWRYDVAKMGAGDVLDPNFAGANVGLKTLSYNGLFSPNSVAATESISWRVTSVNPVPTGEVVDFYVWSPSNLVQVGTVPGDTKLLVSMPEGSTYVDFPIKGLIQGTTDIYLQRVKDYDNNATLGVTNYLKRSITVTAMPSPTIKIRMSSTGLDQMSIDETSSFNTAGLFVDVAPTYGTDTWVRLDSVPVGQSNLTFSSSPMYVKVPAGASSSSEVRFSVPDGTILSAGAGVAIYPVVTNAGAAAYYSIQKQGTVYINNVKPRIIEPLTTDTPTASRGIPFNFTWTVTDVPNDVASGMTVTWNFGDGQTTNVSGSVGSVPHTYATTGTKQVKVTARDKDGGISDEVAFTMTVVPPTPSPSVRVVPDLSVPYTETTTNSTGFLSVYLSEAFTEDVYVRLATFPAGQSNIVLSTLGPVRIPLGSTNYPGVIRFSVPDGTPDSERYGIIIEPTITNAAAASYYTDRQTASVFVNNQRPTLASPLNGTVIGPIPSTVPYSFFYQAKDVNADLATMLVHWQWDSGTADEVVTGAVGTVMHTYTVQGTHTVTVYAEDKDGGISDSITLSVIVGPPPTVSVITPAYELSETPNSGSLDQIYVRLSTTFSNAVTVSLAVTPANSAANGTLTLGSYNVSIPAGQTEAKISISNIKDGTSISRNTGFTITPTVTGATPAAIAYFGLKETGLVTIRNEAPVIITPIDTGTSSTNASIPIAQGDPHVFSWYVQDVDLDSTSTVGTGMKITWNFGDGTSVVMWGYQGNVTHTYTSAGDMIVNMIAEDKDGGRDEAYFRVTVTPGKTVLVTPIGPNASSYWGAAGIGNGMVFSTGAKGWQNLANVYYFKYDPTAQSAILSAVPYKAGSSGYQATNYYANGTWYLGSLNLFDSFFYTWVGADQGLPAADLVPATANSTTVISLPSSQTGGTTATASSVDVRSVQAIFSQEYRIADNVGDINQDGIPDKIATRYNLPTLASGGTTGTGTTGGTPAELIRVGDYNADNDFLPGVASGGGAIIGGMSNVFAVVGDPFTAFLEVRGFHPGLNSTLYGSDPDYGPGETRTDVPVQGSQEGTDPTTPDTDGDNFPDGWEYYFWYNSMMKHQTGLAYNPLDVAQPTVIDYPDIISAFDPLVPAAAGPFGAAIMRDMDKDGITDYEELAMGTNPINWDTDGDGICDGWEVLRGMNPNDSRDGLNANLNNRDGDFMAIATVDREFVTVVNGTTTNTYLAKNDAEIGTANGTFTTWYRYGDTNAPIAVGRPVTLPGGAVVTDIAPVQALIMHYQVYQEFGFDPRTAWIGRLSGRFPAPNTGAAPNTRAFTAYDEYLLLKFMAEVQRNGAATPATTQIWSANSTHPLTPDSDATASATDGMPDGWELYVACGPTGTAMAIGPWDPADGGHDQDGEIGGPLINTREFAGTDSCAAYSSAALYGAGLATVTITRPAADAKWLNKFWPSDPWNTDTDGDGLSDTQEAAVNVLAYLFTGTARSSVVHTTFQYGTGVDNGGPCIRGGGLNPSSMDTDFDGLTDTWEYDYAGYNTTSTNTGFAYIDKGMDGTHGPDLRAAWYTYGDVATGPDAYVTGSVVTPRDMDFDHDGLQNYQEYWVQAVRSFRYDYTAADLPMDVSSDPSAFFTEITNEWDVAQIPFWMTPSPTEWVLLPIGFGYYCSTDPRNYDSDYDGMDDFYEMFHGLNPILGNTAAAEGDLVALAYLYMIDYGSEFIGNGWGANLPMDFMTYPWLTGLPEADPDADGLRNFEECILPDTAAPFASNTDPSPIWLTDDSSDNSVTKRFYWFGGMYFWPDAMMLPNDYKMFSYEMNEGYDTDNDGICDKSELLQTSTSQSDPQNHDDPIRRQAIWFSGTNSAAQTMQGYTFNEWAFRSFTVELWARPEVANREQVLIERPIAYGPSDLSTTGLCVRVNFRIGIAADGRVYTMFQNAGLHDEHTGVAVAYGRKLNTNEWVHVASRMDGATGRLQLFVNGTVETTVPTLLIPANGVVSVLNDPDLAQYPNPYYILLNPGVLVVGAANINPTSSALASATWADFAKFYQGHIDEVRVWDGARSDVEILADYKKRYKHDDLLAFRRAVKESAFVGGSRIVGVTPQLPPELIYHFTFDNLFSADRVASVAKEPRGFNSNQVAINRPTNSVVGWWDALTVKSTVYNDYGYIPWIENGVAHLPIYGGAFYTNLTQVISHDSDTVRNSVFWSHYVAGVLQTPPSFHGLAQYTFPNSSDPYGYWYMASMDTTTLTIGGLRVADDLLPLGDAWAKQANAMWDDGSPSGVWAETGNDSDSDGLPDWWENYIKSVYGAGTNLGWYDLYPDGSGMTAGERYLRDIAKGYTESNNPNNGWNPATLIVQTADSDNDGLPDWWENLFNLNPNDATGINGGTGDSDRDGLSNYAEYLISEKYGFAAVRPTQFKSNAAQTTSDYFLKKGYLYFGEMFADHDFMEDAWEDQYDLNYVNRYVYDAQMDPDEDGWSNWAECRYSGVYESVRPDAVMSTEALGNMKYEFPVPVIEASLGYNGVRASGNIVIDCYSSSAMDGQPDAVYTMPFGANSGTIAKSLPLGYWENRVIKGRLSPGGVQPGTIKFKFTDMWTGVSSSTGFDFDGYLYAGSTAGTSEIVGTVNYETGEFTFDMSIYAGSIIPLTDKIQKRVDYIDCELSYIEMSYGVKLVDAWPKKLYLSRADTGYIREGTNYFVAFMDLNNNGLWEAGEPLAMADSYITDVGWDVNKVDFQLTDYTPGYLRMMLTTGQRSEDVYFGTSSSGAGGASSGLATHVRVLRKLVDGSGSYRAVVFDKVIESPRSFLHEGDSFELGQLALDWGLVGVSTAISRNTVVYEVYKGDMPEAAMTNGAVAVFTNTFDNVRARAVSTYPVNGAYVYSARPTFKWTMPIGYNAFAIEIRKGSSAGTVVYAASPIQAPKRDNDGNYVWTAPIYADDRVPSSGQTFSVNTVYAWRIMAMNAKYSDTSTGAVWSDWKQFRLDVNKPSDSSGYGALRVRVKYHGAASSLLANRVKVQAFRNAAFAGVPEAEYTLSAADLNVMTSTAAASVNAVLNGLAVTSAETGECYLRAIIDHNGNGTRDVWESWGYANYYGTSDHPYNPKPYTIAAVPQTDIADIEIEDADSDQDWFPDAWEYERNSASADFLNLTGPSPSSDPDAEINPWLSLTTTISRASLYMTLSMNTTDLDSDGIGDLAELLLGSNANATSTAGDGYTDGQKLSLGLAPADKVSLNLTGLNAVDPANPAVQWTLGVQTSATADRTFASATGLVTYQVLYTPTLANAQWSVVKTGSVALSGVQALTSQITNALSSGVDPAQGFFRVRLVPLGE